MSTKLDRLLESIDPNRTLDVVSARTDRAVNSFSMDTARIDQWEGFKSCMASFYRHVFTTVLRASGQPELPLDSCWGRCVRLLDEAYGRNGEKAAFEMSRTGAEGGLYGVLRTVAGLVAEELAHNEITARVGRYWDSLSVDEQLDAATEYLEKYGHLLPSELTEGSAARIRANFPRVLERHPALTRRMRRLGR